ncbi:uncharacterized protein LOC125149319 [Prionailurus viverrinus]|uniref:uncharacterized protein LOC125149319 n=1 Tax=Prionailurus viverrinus TaxID=61388 RepID=UPI001FF12FF1|nr:uncharacterized protein LOC125149319 [Prionailurus viverrinus]
MQALGGLPSRGSEPPAGSARRRGGGFGGAATQPAAPARACTPVLCLRGAAGAQTRSRRPRLARRPGAPRAAAGADRLPRSFYSVNQASFIRWPLHGHSSGPQVQAKMGSAATASPGHDCGHSASFLLGTCLRHTQGSPRGVNCRPHKTRTHTRVCNLCRKYFIPLCLLFRTSAWRTTCATFTRPIHVVAGVRLRSFRWRKGIALHGPRFVDPSGHQRPSGCVHFPVVVTSTVDIGAGPPPRHHYG